jgi:hypothetical protein
VVKRRRKAYAPISRENAEGVEPGILAHEESGIPETCWRVNDSNYRGEVSNDSEITLSRQAAPF